MAGGISVHAVDVTRGLPAKGLKVTIFQVNDSCYQVAEGLLTPQGTLDHPIVRGEKVEPGLYEAVFYIGDFYRQLGYPLPNPPFLDVVPYQFGIGDVEQHYHLPLKFSPWGFSLFRGG
jgi:5-hydroxyisourate hydrolase